MFVKTAIVLLAISALVSASPIIGDRDDPLENLALQGGYMFPQMFSWFNNAGKRMSKGFNGVYDEMKGSLDETINSYTQAGQKAVESGSKTMQTGIKTFFLIPTWIRHSADQEPQQIRPQQIKL